MERIALTSHVHGNLTALEAVLAVAREVGVPRWDGYEVATA